MALGIQGVANSVVEGVCMEQPVDVAVAAQRSTPKLLSIKIKPLCVATLSIKGLTID